LGEEGQQMMSAVDPLIVVLVALGIACVVAGGALAIAFFVGPRKMVLSKVLPYECGMPPSGGARDRVSVKYYLVAILFLLFDLEAAFLIPVAVSWKELIKFGPSILGFMAFFMMFFVAGIWYELKVKAIEWEQ
jgi:NADH-quinone oxidoreductase subunit A